MKTLRTILMGVAALAAILIAATFLIPAKTSLQRSVEIVRPPSLVYAYVSDINGFNEFSPWRASDPAMTQSVTGPTGPGQKMTWSSQKMGKGSMTVTAVKPYESVNFDLNFSGSKAASTFSITPVPTGSKVTWGFETTAGLNPIDRVMNFVMKGVIAKDYDAGLAKLKVLAEGLPNIDLAGLNVSTVELASRPMIFVPIEVPNTDPDAARKEILRGMNKANAVLVLNDLEPSGAGVIVYTSQDNGLIKANAGFPMATLPTPEAAAALIGSAKVVFGELSGGKMLRAESPANQTQKTLQQLEVYAKLMRRTLKGAPQEAFPAGPQGATELFYPVD